MQKKQMRQHCRRGGGEEAEPVMALWACEDGSSSYLHNSLKSYDCVGPLLMVADLLYISFSGI